MLEKGGNGLRGVKEPVLLQRDIPYPIYSSEIQVREITIYQPYPTEDSIINKIGQLTNPDKINSENQGLLEYLNQLKVTPHLNPRERNVPEQVCLIEQCVTDRVEFIGELYNLSLVKTDESDPENNIDAQLKQIGYHMDYIFDKDNAEIIGKFFKLIKPIIKTESARTMFISGLKENHFHSPSKDDNSFSPFKEEFIKKFEDTKNRINLLV